MTGATKLCCRGLPSTGPEAVAFGRALAPLGRGIPLRRFYEFEGGAVLSDDPRSGFVRKVNRQILPSDRLYHPSK